MLYRSVLTIQKDGAIAANLGAVLREQQQVKQARNLYLWAIDECSWHPTLYLNAANCFQALGELERCTKTLKDALKRLPNDQIILQSLSRCNLAKGESREALEILSRLTQARNVPKGTWRLIGIAWSQLGKKDNAIEAFNKAVVSEPEDAYSAGQLIIQLKEKGEFREANERYEKLSENLRIRPETISAKASVLAASNEIEAASELYKGLSCIDPNNGDHWLNLACCQRELKQVVAPWETVKEGLRRNPSHTGLQLALIQLAADLGSKRLSTILLKNWLGNYRRLSDAEHRSVQFLGAGYQLLNSQKMKTLASRWEAQREKQKPIAIYGDQIRTSKINRRLKIGYLSSDLCQHPVGKFLLPLIKNHNKSHVWILGIHTGRIKDHITDNLRSHCDAWLNLSHCSDLQAARIIADHQLDVLIELGGYTGGSRLGILIHKPAPLQLSYLGYFAPTYLKCIDGWIGDSVLFSSLDENDKRANQLTIHGGYMAFEETTQWPKIVQKERRSFRFGCFNNSRKLTDDTISLFARVMAVVPHAELAIKSNSFIEEKEKDRICQRLVGGGIAKERIVILPWCETEESHLDSYRHIDVALDTIPYSGATTSCEALAMGVPVVTMGGQGMVGQLSASILNFSGNQKWITHSEGDYIDLAKRLALEGVRSKKQRKQLRHQVKNSQLGDAKRLAREIEARIMPLVD